MKKKFIGAITGGLLIAAAVLVTANSGLNQGAKMYSGSTLTASAENSSVNGQAGLTDGENRGKLLELDSKGSSVTAVEVKTKKSTKLTIDDYMKMYDSIGNFKAFVNKRDDLTKSQKKKVIKARTQQIKVSDELMDEYKKILTDEEMDAYLKAPEKVAVVAGAMPADNKLYDDAVSKIEKATKKDKNLADLSKKLDKIKASEPYHSFIKKVEKEKSKLLGF